MAFVPDHEFEELCWKNDQLVAVMQGQNSKGHKQRSWPVNASSDRSIFPESKDAALLSTQRASGKDGTLEAVVREGHGVRNSTAGTTFLQEDEMASWLQYSFDEPLEKLCPELLSEFPDQNILVRNNDQGQSAVESGQVGCTSSRVRSLDQGRTLGVSGEGHCDASTKPVSGRTAREVQPGRFGTVTVQPSQQSTRVVPGPFQRVTTFKQSKGFFPATCSKRLNSIPTVNPSSKGTPGRGSFVAPSQMPPPKMQSSTVSNDGASQLGTERLMNFPHFSRPAAAVKADLCNNLHNIGVVSGFTRSERIKQLDREANEACMSTGSSIESSATGVIPRRNALLTAVDGLQNMGTPLIWHAVQNVSSKKEADGKLFTDDAADCSVRAFDPSTGWNSCVTSNAALGPEKEAEIEEGPEPTVTSSSGGSGNSGKVACAREKRKAQDDEDSECQSEDPDDETTDVKKPIPARSTSAKRSRAAVIHNESERRRRDRINERMRALQALIPNSNKTDKASLLEEAIEYLKALQTQLQMMCMRSGMGISPLLIPPRTQHLQMMQMASVPHMGMGIGMGMGMGMLDMGVAASSRHAVQVPSIPGIGLPVSTVPAAAYPMLPLHMTAPQVLGGTPCGPSLPKPTYHYLTSTSAMPVSCQNQLQASHARDYKVHEASHQMPMSFQAKNMNVYNTLATQHMDTEQVNSMLDKTTQ